jgi:hypothetical protein
MPIWRNNEHFTPRISLQFMLAIGSGNDFFAGRLWLKNRTNANGRSRRSSGGTGDGN